MNVQPRHVRAAYAMLRELPPFDRWRLPRAEEIKFEITLEPSVHAEYQSMRRHVIRVNADTHTTLEQLLASVAHEMVHLRQELRGLLPAKGDGHNAAFRRMRKTVCHSLGFDVQSF